jgi:SAM-dependent MidA family methyltransferase
MTKLTLKSDNLPLFDQEIKKHGERVTTFIRQEIHDQGGQITFAQFMKLALYAPGLGYYSAGLRKFGPDGDFVTAPEISPLFAYCLANQCQSILAELTNPIILEFGAGTGMLAAELLLTLKKQNALPQKYLILEISADLRNRQQNLLRQRCPDLMERIIWLDGLPTEKFDGIILANEVLDAMPIHRFQLNDTNIKEYYVAVYNDEFTWQLDAPSSSELIQAIKPIQKILPNISHYDSEINLMLGGWLSSCSALLNRGLILLLDYGFPRHEYYHPQRNMGTLMCHFRHRSHDNPLILAGLQDITAHVDFTLIAEKAINVGLSVSGYTTQANFLLNCGLTQFLSSTSTEQQLKLSNQIKRLTLPSEMGELFKVIALTRAIHTDLMGFQSGDRRGFL